MKVQEYSLTGNEKFSVWHTTMLMMTDAQLDHDSKARIMKFVKVLCVGEYMDIKKLENDDPDEIEKSKEKQKELEAMKKAIWKEMDKIMQVLKACYGEAKDVKTKCRYKN